MKKYYICLMPLVVIFLTGCGLFGDKQVQTAKVDEIETIIIEHGSTNLFLKSVDQPDLEASYNKRNIAMDKNGDELTLGVESSSFWIGPKLNLNGGFEVTIPTNFKGKVVIKGSSGNVSSEQLTTSDLDIVTKSGDILIAFEDFHSDIHVVTTSGDVELVLNEEQPDIQLSSKTKSGSHIIAIPIPISQVGKEVDAISGNGEFEITIKTTSGDIVVR